MYIFEQLNKSEVLRRLRAVTLLNSSVQPYKKAKIAFNAKVNPSILMPCQNYVLNERLQDISTMITDLAVSPLGLLSSKFCQLAGCRFSHDKKMLSLIPPIIENWEGKLIIADGMHRCFYALHRDLLIDVIMIKEIDEECPYYALPLPNRWKDVKIVDSKPEIGKVYKEPDSYKRLFRDYNGQFPNVQMKR